MDKSCFDCFKINCEYDESDKYLTLKAMRENYRSQLKVYSFLVKEVSKPSVVSQNLQIKRNFEIVKGLENKSVLSNPSENQKVISVSNKINNVLSILISDDLKEEINENIPNTDVKDLKNLNYASKKVDWLSQPHLNSNIDDYKTTESQETLTNLPVQNNKNVSSWKSVPNINFKMRSLCFKRSSENFNKSLSSIDDGKSKEQHKPISFFRLYSSRPKAEVKSRMGLTQLLINEIKSDPRNCPTMST